MEQWNIYLLVALAAALVTVIFVLLIGQKLRKRRRQRQYVRIGSEGTRPSSFPPVGDKSSIDEFVSS